MYLYVFNQWFVEHMAVLKNKGLPILELVLCTFCRHIGSALLTDRNIIL